MKLRTAKKVAKAIGTPDESRYTAYQTGKAMDRIERTKSYRESVRFVVALMRKHPEAFKRTSEVSTPIKTARVIVRATWAAASDTLSFSAKVVSNGETLFTTGPHDTEFQAIEDARAQAEKLGVVVVPDDGEGGDE